MSIELDEVANAGGAPRRAVNLTPQARRLLEGPVLATLLGLAAPTVALMLLQGVIAAGEAAFVGRLGSHALAGVSLSFPLVMLMTTLSAGAYGGGVASGVARALGAGRGDDAAGLAGTAARDVGHLRRRLDGCHGAFRTVVLLRARGIRGGPGSRGPLLQRALPRGRSVLAVQCRRKRPARERQHGVPRRRGRGRRNRDVSDFAACHLRSGHGPRAGYHGGGLGRGWIQHGDGGRAATCGLGSRLRHAAEQPSARAAPALRVRDPSDLGAERGQYAGDQPYVHHSDCLGRAIWSGSDCRVRRRRTARVPVDPRGIRRGLGPGSPGRRERRPARETSRPRPPADAGRGAALGARGHAGWLALLPTCSRRPGWACSRRTALWRRSEARTWSGSGRPTPFSGWDWPCTSPRKAAGGRRSHCSPH